MAKEYIDRGYLLIGGIHYKNSHVSEEGLVMIPLRDIRKSIKEAPAADVVEVVRCKDCRYCFDGECWQHQNHVVMKVPDFGEHYSYCSPSEVTEDHFCSYGERRDA